MVQPSCLSFLDDTPELLLYILGANFSRVPQEDYARVATAIDYARDTHREQRRASGEPYFVHPIEAARILAEFCPDADSIIAALLHDTIEDCNITHAQIREKFGQHAALLVEGVTKISNLRFNSRHEEKVENLRKMILAMATDVRVIFIKLADRLHNMMTMEPLPPEKRIRISTDTLMIYAPLANRMGMTRLKCTLEDLAMRWVHPLEFHDVSEKVKNTAARDEEVVHLAREEIAAEMEKAGLHAEVKGRKKHIFSIYSKMQRRNLEFKDIYDIIGLRVICEELKHCYDILGIVHHIWHPVHGMFDDYISVPKENGYQSLHTTVIGPNGSRLEVQIRTREMNRYAEEGMAAHWKYKEGGRLDGKNIDLVAWIRQTAEVLTDVQDPTEFMDSLAKDAFSDRVFVFTPQGDVFDLPAGATPLDFAYYVHSKVGDHCQGARVNDRMVTLHSTLHNGDKVEIITAKATHPVRNWLRIAKTPRAWAKIRHYLRTADFDKNHKHGRTMLVTALRRREIVADWDAVEKQITPHLKAFRMATFKDVVAEIGLGTLTTQQIINRCWTDVPRKNAPKKPAKQPVAKPSEQGVIIGGLTNVTINFAGCCTPLPGEDIIGYVTIGRGVTVHTSDCPSLGRFHARNQSGRLVIASWDLMNPPMRTVQLRVESADRQGLLYDLAGVIAGENISITHVTNALLRGDGVCILFTVAIDSVDQLDRLCLLLSQRKGVRSVLRVKKGTGT